MYSDNKQIRDVADVAARIMAGLPPIEEELKGGQVKLDKNHNGKLDGQDFKILRGQKKTNEEVEQVDEGVNTNITLGDKVKNKDGGHNQDVHYKGKKIGHIESYKHRTGMKYGMTHDASGDETAGSKSHEDALADLRAAHAEHLKTLKEEVEQIDEVKMADLPSTKVQGRAYGSSKPQPSALDLVKGPKEKELKSIESEKKKKKMSEMVAIYKESGMKAFFESVKKEDMISEEPDSAQFAKELEDQKKRADGTKPQAEVAKPSVQAVQQEATEQEIQVINADVANGVDAVNIEERTLTAAETGKKEEIVKSMKKGLAGFKERYGKDAKSVMYATATKQAKLKEETDSEQYKAGHEYASDHAQDSGFKVTARARKKEMLADNPHKKGTTEHSDWHRGALDGHQTALDNM